MCLVESGSDGVKSEDTGVLKRSVNNLTLLVWHTVPCTEGVYDLP
jgi:hypothetical protein